MRNVIVWGAVVLLSFVAGAGIAAYVTYAGTMATMIGSAVDADATAVQRYVGVLQDARGGRVEEAIEGLESWLDDVLIMVMEPSNFEHDIDARVVARADSAYRSARAYRTEFPRSSDRSFVDEMIGHVWAAGPPSGFGESR